MAETVYWITGLSGAGKTTVAGLLTKRLRRAGRPVLLLDGDRLRSVFGEANSGFSREDRLRLASCYGRLCGEVASQGIEVVCATISLFHEVHDWNRAHIPQYREILLSVSLEELRRRDPKGLYADGKADMVGVGLFAELPQAPDLVIENHGAITAEAAVDRIWDALVAVPTGAPA
jgi:adenylylsulfate kinase